jgi:hypothetical protein
MAGHTPGPWRRKSIPGHLFELNNAAGDIILRIRGGIMPTLTDARLLAEAPAMLDALRNVAAHFDCVGEEDEAIAVSVRALLTRIDSAT